MYEIRLIVVVENLARFRRVAGSIGDGQFYGVDSGLGNEADEIVEGDVDGGGSADCRAGIGELVCDGGLEVEDGHSEGAETRPAVRPRVERRLDLVVLSTPSERLALLWPSQIVSLEKHLTRKPIIHMTTDFPNYLLQAICCPI